MKRAAALAALLAVLPPSVADAAPRVRANLRTPSAASALQTGVLRVRVVVRRAVRARIRVRAGRLWVVRSRRVRLRARRPRVVRLRLTQRGIARLRSCQGWRLVVKVRKRRRVLRLPAGRACRAVTPAAPTPAGGEPFWPTMRHDARNTGRTDVVARYAGDRPWSVVTGKGIFSTPVIGADGTTYVGSADTTFYALDGAGRERWTYRTGGIVDAAGALLGDTVVMGSGDEKLYRLRLADGRPLWDFEAAAAPATGQLVNWWEGNVALGPDGDLYAGNTGGGAYRISPDGEQRWMYQAGNSVWTTPAFGEDGTSYWGSLDLNVFALNPDGSQKWATSTVGYVVSSPAVSADGGTIYVASFDGRLYALDAATGAPRWTFQMRDHAYSSPALAPDGTIYVASTDGSVYSVTPDGRQRWRYDTGDPVRSSPVLGRKPAGEDGDLVYVGSANGSLYVLDAGTGARRWSFDTTPDDPSLRDRNDLNGSPALGPSGVVIGGEHGRITYVPYDWCLVRREDPRCTTAPDQPFGADLARLFGVTSGGQTRPDGLDETGAATSLFTRLVVREGGRTVDAGLTGTPPPTVVADPPFPFTSQLSGDGHHLFVVPDGFLDPGTTYRVRIGGTWSGEGARPAGGQVGASRSGSVDDEIVLRTAPAGPPPAFTAGGDAVTALRLRRLAVPLPAFLTSVNQIGFDSYDLIAGTIAATPPGPDGEGRFLLWVIGGKRGADGTEVADPAAGFGFPIAGRYRGDSFILRRADLSLTFSFGEVPLRRFELRGRLTPELTARPGASLYAEVLCPEVPNYGPLLVAIGLCNGDGVLPAGGTFLMDRYDDRGAANRRPAGVTAGPVALTRPTPVSDGEATAELTVAPGTSYRAADHVVSIVLADADTGEPVTVDYVKATTVEADAAGNVRRVRVALPRGTEVPAQVRAFVVADAFPLAVSEP